MKMYCIYDRISGKYGPVVEMDNDATMMRAVRNTKDPIILGNPGDFDVFYLGEKDDVTGQVLPGYEFKAHVTDVIGGVENGAS